MGVAIALVTTGSMVVVTIDVLGGGSDVISGDVGDTWQKTLEGRKMKRINWVILTNNFFYGFPSGGNIEYTKIPTK